MHLIKLNVKQITKFVKNQIFQNDFNKDLKYSIIQIKYAMNTKIV